MAIVTVPGRVAALLDPEPDPRFHRPTDRRQCSSSGGIYSRNAGTYLPLPMSEIYATSITRVKERNHRDLRGRGR
ncbi:MAG: hypothetical protein PVF68_05245, partial [Acidobacteriota bacterium]